MKCEKCGYEWRDESLLACPSCDTPLVNYAGEDIYRRGVAAEREGKHKTAARYYAAAADSGVPCAAYAVCRTLEAAGERRENPDLYEFWLFTAAKQDPIATLAYADYLDRMGDARAAFRYLHAAADMGHTGAMVRLGRYYMRHGNRPAARHYFSRASSRSLRARVYLFFLGRRRPTYAPTPPEMPDHTVEAYTVGCYALTLDVPHIAYSCFEEAASASYPPALERAADMCMRGHGCNRDEEKVQSYLNELGEAGKTEAFVRLGDYFVSGALGGTPNTHAAYQYYLRAAKAGNATACVRVGDCLYDGDGVERDAEAALTWYDRASDVGSEEGRIRAARVRSDAEELACHAAEALKEGREEDALRDYREAARLGHTSAISALGDLYLRGIGVKASPREAAWHYADAASRGDTRAKYRLACLYLANHGVRYDKARARALLETALREGYEPAGVKLEEMKARARAYYANKLYSVSCTAYHRRDMAEVVRLRTAAARLGHARATFYLACMYDCGDGVSRDAHRAALLYERAAALGFDGKARGYYSKYLHRLPR